MDTKPTLKTIFVRAGSGRVAHKAYEQGPTFCGLRRVGIVQGTPTKVCRKCCPNWKPQVTR